MERTFLGEQVVAFRTESGSSSVVSAYCPHLGANLARGGRVIGETLAAPSTVCAGGPMDVAWAPTIQETLRIRFDSLATRQSSVSGSSLRGTIPPAAVPRSISPIWTSWDGRSLGLPPSQSRPMWKRSTKTASTRSTSESSTASPCPNPPMVIAEHRSIPNFALPRRISSRGARGDHDIFRHGHLRPWLHAFAEHRRGSGPSLPRSAPRDPHNAGERQLYYRNLCSAPRFRRSDCRGRRRGGRRFHASRGSWWRQAGRTDLGGVAPHQWPSTGQRRRTDPPLPSLGTTVPPAGTGLEIETIGQSRRR